jgi:hypothetical protein
MGQGKHGTSSHGARRSCLVAVDGTRSGVAALVWALRHASDRDMDVEVLTVWPAHHSVLIHEVPGHFCSARWDALAAQERTVHQAVLAVPAPPPITTRLVNASAAEAIVRASRSHDLVVLGSDRAHEPHRLTDLVIKDAACPVVVRG